MVKKRKSTFTFYLATVILYFPFFCTAQTAGWSLKTERPKCFIENQGQFRHPISGEEVLFAVDNGPSRIYFTTTGVCYSMINVYTAQESEEKTEREKEYNRRKIHIDNGPLNNEESEEKRTVHTSDFVTFIWENASPEAEIITTGKKDFYFSYSFTNESGKEMHKNEIPAFEKITYKNIYPNTDIEYTIHPAEGIKYSITLYPGADPSLIKMKYDTNHALMLKNGDLHIATRFGDIIDHAPVSFYADNKNEIISSQFSKSNGGVSFSIGNYDKNRALVIDPWVVTPTYVSNWDCVWECDEDGAGNVYTIGGVNPMLLNKYNAAGALQWSYSTPYDTSMWLGTLATDNAGNSYVTNGSTQRILKVNAAGTLQFSNNSPGGAGILTEFWSIAFNCDETKLVIGGTGGGGLTPTPYAYDVNTSTGAVMASQKLAGGGGLMNSQEARAITPCGNAKYYWLAHDTMGYFHQNFSFCPGQTTLFKRANGFSMGYKCENWRYDNTGICAIKANNTALYLNRGNVLQKRDLSTAVITTTATITGGNYASNQAQNSGIDIDNCGNVYVGSINQVLKFDANLALLATYTTSFTVFDVHVTTGGNIIACGATGTSGTASRTGYIQQIAAGACATLTLTCCDAAICGPSSTCITAGSVTLTANTPGGTWSGTGVNASGVFDPATAGVGIHTITYSLSCGTGTLNITVTPTCAGLQVCQESDGTLTISNGIATYTWSYYVPASSTPITNSAQCVACGRTWFFGSCLGGNTCPVPAYWQNFATGSNSGVLPGSFPANPIKVTDATGASITISSLSGIPACNVVLPVEWLSFKGKCDAGITTLTWSTASEKNNSYFIVEGSRNGEDFVYMKSVAGSGTSFLANSYSTAIENNGLNFYRIKQVDANGKASYSSIIFVNCRSGPGMFLHPNPATNQLNLSLDVENDMEVELTVIDALGREVLKRTNACASGSNTITIDISELKPAAYFIKVTGNDQGFRPENLRFVKQGR